MADRRDKKQLDATDINRRGVLKCMGWARTRVVWSLKR
jgi:hypothetical protein